MFRQETPRQCPTANRRDAEIRRFFSQIVDDFERVLKCDSRFVQRVCNFNSSQHADDAIKAATAGDRVGMRTDDDWRESIRITCSPADQVPGCVQLCHQTGRVHLLTQPLAALRVPRGEWTPRPARLIWIVETAQHLPIAVETLCIDGRQRHAPTSADADTGRTKAPWPGLPTTSEPS